MAIGRMKMMRASFVLIAAMTAVSVWAQTIQFVVVTKLRDYDQTSASDPALVANPYLVGASIDGTGLSGSYPVSPTVLVQSTSQPLITLTEDGGNWHFESAGYADQTALNAAYGSGNYTVQSSSFSNIVLTLSDADLYPNAPKATISTNSGLGFDWIGNVLVVNPSLFTTLTIQTNTFGINFSASANHIGIHGDGFTTEVSYELFNTAANNLSLDIASATFLGGSSSKNIELEFNNLIDQLANTPVSGAQAISAFTSATRISIQVIPEPSTYAAIFGALALAGVTMVRRRRSG